MCYCMHSNAYALGVGDTLPHCSMSSSVDSPINFQDYQGKVIYVDFWASWCPSCMQSFPFLNQLTHEFSEKGLRVIGINLDEQYEDAHAFLVRYPSDFIIANHGAEQCAKTMGVQAMPTAYLIDKQGVIRHVQMGFRAGEVDELKSQIIKLLAEK